MKQLLVAVLATIVLSLSCGSAYGFSRRGDREDRFVLLSGDGVYCSGVIVQTNYVVTAGHCVDGTNNLGLDGYKGQVLLDDDEKDFALLRVPTRLTPRVRVRGARQAEWASAMRTLSVKTNYPGWGRIVNYGDGTIAIQMRGWPGMSGAGVWAEDGAWLGIVVAFYVVSGEPADVTWGPSAPAIMSEIITYLENDR